MSHYRNDPVVTYPWFRCGQQQRSNRLHQLNNFISDVVFSELNRARCQLHQQQQQRHQPVTVVGPHLTQHEMSWNGSTIRLPGRQQEEQQFLLSNLQAQLVYEYYHQLENMPAGKPSSGNCNTMRQRRQQQQQWKERRLGDLLTPFLFVYVPLFNNVALPSLPMPPATATASSNHQPHQQLAANIMFPTRLANLFKFLQVDTFSRLLLATHNAKWASPEKTALGKYFPHISNSIRSRVGFCICG